MTVCANWIPQEIHHIDNMMCFHFIIYLSLQIHIFNEPLCEKSEEMWVFPKSRKIQRSSDTEPRRRTHSCVSSSRFVCQTLRWRFSFCSIDVRSKTEMIAWAISLIACNLFFSLVCAHSGLLKNISNDGGDGTTFVQACGAAATSSTCLPSCTKNGTCNEELGR